MALISKRLPTDRRGRTDPLASATDALAVSRFTGVPSITGASDGRTVA